MVTAILAHRWVKLQMNNYLRLHVKTTHDLPLRQSFEATSAAYGADLSPSSELAIESSSLAAARMTKLSVLTILVFLLVACGGTADKVGLSNYPQSNFVAVKTQHRSASVKSATNSPLATADIIDNPQDILCAAEPAVVQQALLQLVNESRKESRMCGTDEFKPVPAIVAQATLQSIANDHSTDMALNNFFSHTGSDGSSVLERAVSAGYNWQHISENIAAGHVTTGEVHAGWLSSPGHCVNIMAAEVTEFGAACVTNESSENKRYWSTAFGRQRDDLL